MRKLVLSMVILIYTSLLFSQNSIGIGTNNPHSSAVLDITSTDKGFLVPRMSQLQRLSINNPSDGLLVYDSTLHRLYQVQEGVWRYMTTNSAWIQSNSHSWTYNGSDSIGIGTSIPTERLDVNGTIQSRHTVKAENNIIAGSNITAAQFTTDNLIVNNNLVANYGITGYGDINLDNTGATLQLQNNTVKKTYFQLSGNDLRMGTNSGNSAGKLILRMNGTDAIAIDRLANIEMLQNNTHEGNVIIGWKLCRVSAPEINMLPVVFGFVPADGGPVGWMSPFNGGWEKVSTGKYEISNYSTTGINPYAVIIATPTATALFRMCTASYIGPNKFRVEVFNQNGTHVDGAFTFVVNNPLN